MSNEKELILAITGGVAAYKSVTIASRLFKAGHKIHIIMTPAATEFVKPLSFAAVTRTRVITEIMPPEDAEGQDLFPHLYPASHADVFCIAPATADTMAKLVHGEADNIVSASALPLPPDCRRYFCPAMNSGMWENPVVQDNARILRERGWIQIGPDEGLLACGDTGYGRMSEPDAIADRILADLSTPRSLERRTVLITSGPTRERIDPVRYISNDSSGKMGKALAEAASLSGANVEFVTGPVAEDNLPRGPRISIHRVESACEMLECAQSLFAEADGAAAAYAPELIYDHLGRDASLEYRGEQPAVSLRVGSDVRSGFAYVQKDFV